MPLSSPRSTASGASEPRSPTSPRSGKRTAAGSQPPRKRTYGTTVKSTSRTTTLSSVDQEGAITKIQSNWRRKSASKHVFLLQLVLFETKRALDAQREEREEREEEEDNDVPLKPIERLRETAWAVMHSVRKCVQALKATEFMKKDRLKAERVAKLKSRFQAAQRTVRNLTKLRVATKRAKEVPEEVDERLVWIDNKLKNSREAYEFDKAARRIQKVWTERAMRRLQEANERWARLYSASRMSSRRSSQSSNASAGLYNASRMSSRRSSQNSNASAGLQEDMKVVLVASNHSHEAAGGRRSKTPSSQEHAASPELLPGALPPRGLSTPPGIPLPAAGGGRCGGSRGSSPGASELGEDGGDEPFGGDPEAPRRQAPKEIPKSLRAKFELLQARLDRLESLEVAEAAREKRDVKKAVVSIFSKMLDKVSLQNPVGERPHFTRKYRSMGSTVLRSLFADEIPDNALAKRVTLADASPSALLGVARRHRPTPLMPLPSIRESTVGGKHLGEAATSSRPGIGTVHDVPDLREAPGEGADDALDALAHRLPPLLSKRGLPRPRPSLRPPPTRDRPRASVGAHGGFLIRVSLQPPTPLALPASQTSMSSDPRSPSPGAAAAAAAAGGTTPQTGAQPAPERLPETPLGLSLGVAAAAGTASGDWQLVVLGVGPGPVQDHTTHTSFGFRLRRGDRLLSVNGSTDLGEMLSRLADAKGPMLVLEVEMRTAMEANEAAEAAVPIEPGDRLLGPASGGAAGGAGGAGGAQAPTLFAGLERAATLPLLPESPLAGTFEAAEAEAFSRVPTWERHKVLAAQCPHRAHQVPQWLSQSLVAPLLRESVCALGAGDALELLLRLDSSTGWSARSEAHASVRRELHASVVASGPNGMGGGPGLWAALEVGLSGGTVHGSSEVLLPDLDPRLWCEVLFHFGALALQRERDRLADLQDEWTLGSVRSGWKARLEGLDEALGWCAQSLDVLQEVYELTGPVGGAASPSSAAAVGGAGRGASHGGGSAWADLILTVKPSRHATLEREVRRAAHELEVQRRQEAQSVSQASELSDVPVARRGLEHLQAAKARRSELEAMRQEANAGPLPYHVWKESSAGRCAAAAAELRKAGGAWLAPGAFPAAPAVPLPATGRPQAGAGRFRGRRVCAVAPARGLVVA